MQLQCCCAESGRCITASASFGVSVAGTAYSLRSCYSNIYFIVIAAEPSLLLMLLSLLLLPLQIIALEFAAAAAAMTALLTDATITCYRY
jgi:hypothetical protein